MKGSRIAHLALTMAVALFAVASPTAHGEDATTGGYVTRI
jgi:hypothetical protein